jgi:thioredoxin reductase (NADPH)
VDESSETPTILAVLGRGQFTGDVAHLSGGPSLVSAVARVDCDVYEVAAEGVREIINRFPDLGDVILQVLIARRQLLRQSAAFRGLRVIGSRFSRDTWRIRDFLTKNQMPFAWLDLEDDPEVRRLLERFGLSEADTPAVAWGRRLLRPCSASLAPWRGPTGFLRRSRRTAKVSSGPDRPHARTVGRPGVISICWKPVDRACWPLATCGPARSSVSPPRSARVR